MNDLISLQESDTRKPIRFFAILHWLMSFIQLTEEEQEVAGISFGSRYDNEL